MPTDIYFTFAEEGTTVRLRVKEEPEQVHEALNAAGDQPVRLTRHGGGDEEAVYVNPQNVAYWNHPRGKPPRFRAI